MALQSHFDTILAFGDSFTSQCGPCRLPSEELCLSTWSDLSTGLYGNPIRNGCAVNKGWNYVNFLANCTQDNIDPLTCPVRLIDLAYGGAAALKDLSTYTTDESTEDLARLQLAGQVSLWREAVRDQLTFTSERLLSVIWFGLNDVKGLTNAGLEESVEDMHAKALELQVSAQHEAIRNAIGILYEDGIRNFFIPNVPLDIAGAAGTIMTWNQMLTSRMLQWSQELSGSHFLTFDTYAMYNNFQASPSAYGFENIVDMCFLENLRDPSINCTALNNGYLRMDFVHWTAQAHQEMAKLMEHSIDRQMLKISEADRHVTFTVPRFSRSELCLFFGLLSMCVLGLTILTRWLMQGKRSRLSDKMEEQQYMHLEETDS